jgi:excisionase family DNA binding protein
VVSVKEEKKMERMKALIKGIESLPEQGRKEVEAILKLHRWERESKREKERMEKKGWKREEGEREVKVMRISEACRLLGVSPETIRKWEREGLIRPERTALGQRFFTEESLLEIKKVIKRRIKEKVRKGLSSQAV